MNSADIYIPWDGWNLVKFLGQGSFGSVYEIEKRTARTTQKAAMKIIPISADRLDDMYGSKYNEETARRLCEDSLRSIRKEFDLMYELRGNPNIVRCDDMKVVGHRDGIGCDVYIMMELLTPLQQNWRSENISESEVLKLGEDICRALMVCERHKIIHRDIKPQNILVTDSGTYKLGDFGTARTFEHTASATMAGTETYMAPEVIRREKYGRDVDTYSLGLVMYRMLNKGQLPFIDPARIPTFEDRNRSLQKRLTGEPLPAPAGGSRPLQAVVLRACSYDRKNRYSSAADMLEDLILAGEGTMPMFHVSEDDKSTVIDPYDRTGTSTRGRYTPGRNTGKRVTESVGRNVPGRDRGNYVTGSGGGKDKRKGKKTAVIAAVIGLIIIIGALIWGNTDTDDPVEPVDPPVDVTSGEETETGTEEPAEQEDTGQAEQVNTEGINTENFLIAFRNGDYDEAEVWASKNPEYADEGVVMSMPTDIYNAYEETAKQYANDPSGYNFIGYYGYTDIDNDGLPEMVLFTPGGEANKELKIFSYDAGSVKEIGSVYGGHTAVYAYPGHNGLIIGWGHMGSETFSVLSIENGEISMEDFGSREIGENEEYSEPGNMIWLNEIK